LDVPAVAVTLNTNDFGDVATLAVLAQVLPARAVMTADADATVGNLVSTGETYLHGVGMADFAVTCGNLTGITMWAPVQGECDLGTLANNIDQTLFLDEVYVNSLEFSYTTGANATENYGAETDNKTWLLNDGAYVNWEAPTVTDGMTSFTVASGVVIPLLSSGNPGFMRKTVAGVPGITFYDSSANTMVNWPVTASGTAVWNEMTAPLAECFWFDDTELTGTSDGPYTINVPTGITTEVTDVIQVVFCADGYTGDNTYFNVLDAGSNSDVGALRQGQTEISIIDGADSSAMWRLTGCTISADLTREPLTEIGHLGPYDRPLTLPIPITVTVDSTAGDLENWARLAGQVYTDINDIDLTDLMSKDDLILMVKVYEQTDEEAGGTGAARKVNTPSVVGDYPMTDGAKGTIYITGSTEKALKTLIVKNLKITDEGMTLDVGANATQTFGFKSNNDLFVVKGDLTPSLAADLARNAT